MEHQPYTNQHAAFRGLYAYESADGMYADDVVVGDYYGEEDDDASGSSQALNGGAEDLVFRDGYPEANGRKKRRTAATTEDQDYQPPGTKRVST